MRYVLFLILGLWGAPAWANPLCSDLQSTYFKPPLGKSIGDIIVEQCDKGDVILLNYNEGHPISPPAVPPYYLVARYCDFRQSIVTMPGGVLCVYRGKDASPPS